MPHDRAGTGHVPASARHPPLLTGTDLTVGVELSPVAGGVDRNFRGGSLLEERVPVEPVRDSFTGFRSKGTPGSAATWIDCRNMIVALGLASGRGARSPGRATSLLTRRSAPSVIRRRVGCRCRRHDGRRGTTMVTTWTITGCPSLFSVVFRTRTMPRSGFDCDGRRPSTSDSTRSTSPGRTGRGQEAPRPPVRSARRRPGVRPRPAAAS